MLLFVIATCTRHVFAARATDGEHVRISLDGAVGGVAHRSRPVPTRRRTSRQSVLLLLIAAAAWLVSNRGYTRRAVVTPTTPTILN